MGQTLVITDGSHLYSALHGIIFHYAKVWGIEDDFERLYDWLIADGFYRELNARSPSHIKLDNPRYHDLYKCVYNDLEYQLRKHIVAHIETNKINFLNSSKIKILVTYRELVFVKTYRDNSYGIGSFA